MHEQSLQEGGKPDSLQEEYTAAPPQIHFMLMQTHPLSHTKGILQNKGQLPAFLLWL